MKVEQTTVQKLNITELEGLDPVTVFAEDLGKGKGKITINCYDQSWTTYWGAMGNNTIVSFFLSCDNGYLIKNLSCCNPEIDDYDNLDTLLKNEIIKQRRTLDLGKAEASELWQRVLNECSNDKDWLNYGSGAGLMQEIIGDEWWYSIPTKENPNYVYLSKIIDAVKAGFNTCSQCIGEQQQ